MRLIFLSVWMLVLSPVSSFAATEVIEFCHVGVEASNIQVIDCSKGCNLAREQAEFENLGYLVQRCEVKLAKPNIQGIALVLTDELNGLSAYIYQDRF
jgi:hypothetical protein